MRGFGYNVCRAGISDVSLYCQSSKICYAFVFVCVRFYELGYLLDYLSSVLVMVVQPQEF